MDRVADGENAARSLPARRAGVLCQRFGIPATAAPGATHTGSSIHAPDENIFVEDYLRTIKAMALLIHRFGQA